MIAQLRFACGHEGEIAFTEQAIRWAAHERILASERASLCPPCQVRSPKYRPYTAYVSWWPTS